MPLLSCSPGRDLWCLGALPRSWRVDARRMRGAVATRVCFCLALMWRLALASPACGVSLGCVKRTQSIINIGD
eukprot:1242441-Amphidinium_carterae.1